MMILQTATMGLFLLSPVSPATRSSLQDELERFAREAEKYDAQVSLVVRSLTRGEDVIRKNPNLPLSAASNTKLVTTASSIFLLGSNYFFETKFWANAPIQNGVVEGDLWVQGGGDPCWSERFFGGNPLAPLESMIEALQRQGIQRVQGQIVLDDRIFDREFVAPEWPRDQLTLEYCAPVAGISLNEGCVDIEIVPGAADRSPSAKILPAGASIPTSNEIETQPGKGDPRLSFTFTPEGTLKMKGSIFARSGSYNGRIAVASPLDFAGRVIRNLLSKKGIAVQGHYRLVSGSESLAKDAKLLYTHRSPILNAIFLTNKDSENFYAEHLIKAIGAGQGGPGSWKAGSRAIESFLKKIGLDAGEFHIADGSGLSRSNRFSADTFVQLLSRIYASESRDLYMSTLPISGVDGTLKNRLSQAPYQGKVRAKTGWIQGASALSGYATSKSGEVFAFSFLINYKGNTNNRVFKSIQDGLCSALVDSERGAR